MSQSAIAGRPAATALRQVTVAGKPSRLSVAWLAVAAMLIITLAARPGNAWLVDYPQDWTLPIAQFFADGLILFVEHTQPAFRLINEALQWPMISLRNLLVWLPYSVTVALASLVAWQTAGPRTAVLTLMTMFYILVTGYWSESMNTLAIVGVAIPLSMVTGFALGILASRSSRTRKAIAPLLDLMQTVPTFAYLIPVLFLFGFGPVVGLVASAIFALPPMVRNTLLGLQRVPGEIREAGDICGCTPLQRFWWVEVPTARPQLAVGLNQTTMAAFAMIIIAAIIGGFNDIGWEVLSSIRRANFGESLLSGLVIALLAIVLDRVTSGLAVNQGTSTPRFRLGTPGFALAAAAIGVLGLLLAQEAPYLRDWPDHWTYYPAEPLNAAANYVTVQLAAVLGAVKNGMLFYGILPIKIGLERVVTPFTWGFAMSPAVVTGYWTVLAALAASTMWRSSIASGTGVVIAGSILFVGTTGLPWPAFVAAVTLLACHAGGWRVGLFAFLGQLFILLSGMWEQAMISIYLCGVAVAICIALGVSLGVLAASSQRVSAVLRPMNDTLQTIPQFVLLIPMLMLFGVGDFPGLMAIVLYAIVPSIRYTEHGLRSVPITLIEAGRSTGCTPGQLFWLVKLPYALPEILLGINQTILFSLGMLVIASLVGTAGLGQQIYIALGQNDPGLGIVAGLSMALIAMTADRIFQAAAGRRKAALGME